MAAVGNKENARGIAPALSTTELKNILGQCLKLASENKITPQNTWALNLIEHLPELIKESGEQTNFQRASVTLDAGVKIYSYRVDSVHTETFKILGGLGRASNTAEEPEAGDLGDGGVGGDGEEATRRRRRTHELNPEATLESSLEALNVKKFDLAFTVDPLFHKTSAQFDEGGARGLLLNNLSVYHGCDIVFDSMDVPELAMDAAEQQDPHAMVNLGSLQQQQAALQLQTGGERISPTLDAILELLDEAPPEGAAAAADNFVRQVVESSGDAAAAASQPWMQQRGEQAAATAAAVEGAKDGGEQSEDGQAGMEGVVAEYAAVGAPEPADALGDYGEGDDDYGGGDDGGFDGSSDDDVAPSGQQQAGVAGQQWAEGAAGQAAAGGHAEALGEDALHWLMEAGSNDMVTRARGWAGASHWRYRALPQPTVEGEDGSEPGQPKKRSTRRKNDPLDFVALMEQPEAEAPTFELLARRGAPAGGAKRARRSKPAAKTLLPEDHHYQVENLNRYALRPRNAVVAASEAAVGAAGGAGALGSGEEQQQFGDGFGAFGGGGDDYDDDDDNDGGGYDGGWGDIPDMLAGGGMEMGDDQLEMVQATRRVERVEVNYSRAAKQVDVRSLKELMWHGMHSAAPDGAPPSPNTVLGFQDVLSTVPDRNAAGRLEDLSVHLCFICVLHLANEHGLVIQSVPELDRLLISNVPAADHHQ